MIHHTFTTPCLLQYSLTLSQCIEWNMNRMNFSNRAYNNLDCGANKTDLFNTEEVSARKTLKESSEKNCELKN